MDFDTWYCSVIYFCLKSLRVYEPERLMDIQNIQNRRTDMKFMLSRNFKGLLCIAVHSSYSQERLKQMRRVIAC